MTASGIGRTFQNIRLFSHMTALENVLVGQHVRMRPGLFGILARFACREAEERHVRERGLELLDYVGLGRARADELSKNLPYGAQRRLEIARALATDPQMLLLDEPTAGMNPLETADLTLLIRRIRDTLASPCC